MLVQLVLDIRGDPVAVLAPATSEVYYEEVAVRSPTRFPFRALTFLRWNVATRVPRTTGL